MYCRKSVHFNFFFLKINQNCTYRKVPKSMPIIIIKRITLFFTHRFVYTQFSKNTCLDGGENLRHKLFVLKLMSILIYVFFTQVRTNNKTCVHGLDEKSCILF